MEIDESDTHSDPESKPIDNSDLLALCHAKAEPEVRHKKKNPDLFFQAHITSMIALILLILSLTSVGWSAWNWWRKQLEKDWLIMLKISANGWWLTCIMMSFCSIAMVNTTNLYSRMKTLPSRSTSSFWKRSKMATFGVTTRLVVI
jgi:hypothetical protein